MGEVARGGNRRVRSAATATAIVLFCTLFLVGCYSVDNTALPDAAIGVSYSATLTASEGKPPYTWAITSGSLPAGLSLDGATGQITGTPTVLGESTFTATVTGSDDKTATSNLSIKVVVPGTWAQNGMDEGRRGWAGAETSLTPANASGVHDEWSLGAVTSPGVASGGVVYVNGNKPGTSDPTLMAYDIVSSQLVWSVPLSTPNIGQCSSGSIAITSDTVLATCGGTALEAYRLAAPHDRLWTTDDTDPGAAPSDVLISGPYAVTASYSAITAYDLTTGERQWQQLDPTGSGQQPSIAVGGGKVIAVFSDRIDAFNLTNGDPLWEQPVAAASQLVVADGWVYVAVAGRVTQYKVADGKQGWTSPTDPDAGDNARGVYAVDGTTVYSYWEVSDGINDVYVLRALRATSGTERWRANVPLHLRSVVATHDLVWVTTSTQGIFEGQGGSLDAYSVADGSSVASLPFDKKPSSGTSVAQGRLFVRVGAALHVIGLASPLPVITTSIVRSGRVGTAYSQALSATSGTSPYTWTIASGTLPAGLSVSSGGTVSGTPTASGSPTVTFRVTDGVGRTTTRGFVVQVVASGGTSAWSTTAFDGSRNAYNPAESSVGLSLAVQMANRWKTAAVTGTTVIGTEPVSTGGKLFATGRDGALHAWTSTGTGTNRVALWTANADAPEVFVSTPTESSGTLYVVGSDHALYAIRASDGVRLWRRATQEFMSGNTYVVGAPLVTGGRVIIALQGVTGDREVWAVSTSTGALSWGGVPTNLTEPSGGYEAEAPATDGTRVFVVSGCVLNALTASTGTVAWSKTIDVDGNTNCNPYQATSGRPTVAGGVVYAGTFNTTAAFDATDGSVKWKTRQGSMGRSVVSNGALIISRPADIDEFGWNQQPVALDIRDGVELWEVSGYRNTSSPSLAGDLLLFASYTNVYGFDIRTGTRVWDSGTVSASETITAAPAIAATRLFVPSDDGTIRALGPP